MADVLVVLDSIEQAGGDDFEIYGYEAKVASVAFCLRHTHTMAIGKHNCCHYLLRSHVIFTFHQAYQQEEIESNDDALSQAVSHPLRLVGGYHTMGFDKSLDSSVHFLLLRTSRARAPIRCRAKCFCINFSSLLILRVVGRETETCSTNNLYECVEHSNR